MADVVVNAEVRSNIGQLNQDLKKTQQETISIKDAFGAASGAIAASQGAMKLFGVESESTQKAILQVQAAMSMNQGIQSLIKQKDAIVGIISLMGKWTGATKVLAVAQKAFNLIMKANPVGLIVAGVTALIAAGMKMLSVFKSSDDEVKAIDNTFEDLGHTMDKINTKAAKMKILFQDNKRIIDDTGKSEQERLDAQNESTAEQLKLDQEALATLEKRLKKNKTNLADSKSWNAYEKQRLADGKDAAGGVEQSTKRLNKHKKELQATEQAIANLQSQMHANELAHEDKITDIKSFNINNDKKADEERAARNKKAYEDRINAEKDLRKQMEKIEDELTLSAIEDEDERAKKRLEIELENQKESIKNSKASKKVKDEMLLALDKKYLDDLKTLEDEIQDEKDAEQEEKDKLANEALTELQKENLIAREEALAETELELELQRLERQKEAEDAELKQHENYLELKAELDEKYVTLAKELTDQDVQNKKDANTELTNAALAASSKMLSQASEFAGDNKELAAGAAIIDTYAAVAGALREGKGTPLSYLMAASVALAGFKAVQSIYATDVGDGGGGAPPPADIPPAPQMMSGSFELGQTTAPEPLRAFVVTDEMTNSQSQLANIRRRATI